MFDIIIMHNYNQIVMPFIPVSVKIDDSVIQAITDVRSDDTNTDW